MQKIEERRNKRDEKEKNREKIARGEHEKDFVRPIRSRA